MHRGDCLLNALSVNTITVCSNKLTYLVQSTSSQQLVVTFMSGIPSGCPATSENHDARACMQPLARHKSTCIPTLSNSSQASAASTSPRHHVYVARVTTSASHHVTTSPRLRATAKQGDERSKGARILVRSMNAGDIREHLSSCRPCR
jgi:hypothetical protein